ncbi:MAG TPA: CAP domain-containing protein [Gaiellaceae bacterium]|nr:CAP domain-containing protein [Gaiellaceae bacterium]
MLRTRVVVGAAFAAVLLSLVPGSLHAAGSPGLSAGSEQAVVTYVNKYFRGPMGLPSLQYSATLKNVAQNHANYLVAHPNELGHNETPGESGFTGATPSDRCNAVGIAAGCAEVAYAGLDLGDSVRGWLGGPIHGPILLEACSIGFGYSPPTAPNIGTMVGDARYDTCQPKGSPSVAPNKRGSALHVWPANGTAGVWPIWSERETPNPLSGTGFRSANVGFPIYVMNTGATDATVKVTLTGPSGAVKLFQPNKSSTSGTATLAAATANGPTTTAFMPAQLLAFATKYTVTVTPDSGAAYHGTFTTMPRPANPSFSVTNIVKTKVGSQWKLSATVSLTVPFRPDPDYDGVNGLVASGIKIGVVPVLGRTHELFINPKFKSGVGPFAALDNARAQTLTGKFSVLLPPLVVPGKIWVSAHVPTWDGHADEHYNAKNLTQTFSAA